MQVGSEEHLKTLCLRASDEQDLDKLLALVQEINNLLEEKLGRSPNANSAELRTPGQ